MAGSGRKVDWALVWTSIRTHSLVLKIVSVNGDWEGRSEEDVRERHEKGKESEVWRKETTWNPEDLTPSCSCSIISRIAFLMILRTFLAPLILIRQLTHYDSHSLKAVSHPSSSQVIDQATFPFISYLFPMMSHCVSFYYSFFL